MNRSSYAEEARWTAAMRIAVVFACRLSMPRRKTAERTHLRSRGKIALPFRVRGETPREQVSPIYAKSAVRARPLRGERVKRTEANWPSPRIQIPGATRQRAPFLSTLRTTETFVRERTQGEWWGPCLKYEITPWDAGKCPNIANVKHTVGIYNECKKYSYRRDIQIQEGCTNAFYTYYNSIRSRIIIINKLNKLLDHPTGR